MWNCETQVVHFAVAWYHGDSNPKRKHKNKKLVISVTVLVWFLLLLFYLLKHSDLKKGPRLGMRWLFLIYAPYIWLTGLKFACDRLRKQGTTEQVVIIYAKSDPKGNDSNMCCLCSLLFIYLIAFTMITILKKTGEKMHLNKTQKRRTKVRDI